MKQIFGLSLYILLITNSFCLAQSGTRYKGAALLKSGQMFNGEFTLKSGTEILEQKRGRISLEELEELKIDNRRYKVVQHNDRPELFELLVEATVPLYLALDLKSYYTISKGQLQQIPERYFKPFMETLTKELCDCPEISQNLSSSRFSLNTIINAFADLNKKIGGLKYASSGKARALNSHKPEITAGIYFTSSFVHLYQLHSQTESFFDHRENSTQLIPMLGATLAKFGRFSYSINASYQKSNYFQGNPAVISATVGNGGLFLYDSTFADSLRFQSITIMNQLNYSLLPQDSKLKIHLYAGPTIDLFAGRTGFYAHSEYKQFARELLITQIQVEDDQINWSSIKAGVNTGLKFDYPISEKILIRSDLNFNWVYNTFSAYDPRTLFNPNGALTLIQYNERNWQYRAGLNLVYQF